MSTSSNTYLDEAESILLHLKQQNPTELSNDVYRILIEALLTRVNAAQEANPNN